MSTDFRVDYINILSERIMLNTKTNPRNDNIVVAECARFDVKLVQKQNGTPIYKSYVHILVSILIGYTNIALYF